VLKEVIVGYKRNQVEEAILRVFNASPLKAGPRTRSQLKRLLDTDRRLGRRRRSGNREHANYGFYSVEGPGRGVEIEFSKYEAFALLIGLRLMQHSWRQGHVVSVLRKLRPQLEKLHAHVLRQNPRALFDKWLIRQQARPGGLGVTNTAPVFLAISGAREGHSGSNPAAICRGPEVMKFIHAQPLGQSSTVCELVSSIVALSHVLAKTKPSKRGRASA
jgi:hypothetical protein